MHGITDLSTEHSRPRNRRQQPRDCFYCGVGIAAGDIKVPGQSGITFWLHFRCIENFALTLLRGAELVRQANARGLDNLEWAAIA